MHPDEVILRTLLFFLGFAALIYGAKMWYYAVFTPKWPTVKGKITCSKMKTELKKMDSGMLVVKEIHLKYKYQVEGKDYEASRYAFDQEIPYFFGKFITQAKEFIANYPLDALVTIYYRSGKPSVSCLKPGLTQLSNLASGTIGILVSLCIFKLLLFS